MSEKEKKKRNAISLKKKIDIITQLQQGVKQVDLAKTENIPRTTIQTIWSMRDKLQHEFSNKNTSLKKLRKPNFEDVDNALLDWFKLQNSRPNVTIDGPMLLAKAEEFGKIYNHTNFKTSSGWLTKWKIRHNITMGVVSGEAAGVSVTVVDDWLKNVWPVKSQNYRERDIFNCDETGLFFKMLPNRSFHFKGETCSGGKRSKDRLTVLLCCNMDGSEKLKPLVIGKSKNPRCFSKVKDRSSLPVHYYANKTAWMRSDIFIEWLQTVDKQMRKKRRRILLLLDNCGSHPTDVHLTNIELLFLPPNTTSVVQPLDQGIIESFKRKYRQLLVNKVISLLDCQQQLKIDVLNCILMVHSAWLKISQSTISNCFRHGLKTQEAMETEEAEEIEQVPNISGLGMSAAEFEEYQNCDSLLTTEAEQTTEEIASRHSTQNIQQQELESDSENDDEENDNEVPVMSTKQIVQQIDNIKIWIASQQSSQDNVWESVSNLESFAFSVLSKSLTQSKLTKFFAPRENTNQ